MKTTRIKIKVEMLRKGITFKEIGASLNPPVCGQAVSNVAKGYAETAHIQIAISRKIGIPVRELFPDYRPKPRRKRAA